MDTLKEFNVGRFQAMDRDIYNCMGEFKEHCTIALKLTEKLSEEHHTAVTQHDMTTAASCICSPASVSPADHGHHVHILHNWNVRAGVCQVTCMADNSANIYY